MFEEYVPSGPPEFFRQGPTGETHIGRGLWLVKETIHIGERSSIDGTHLVWQGGTKPSDGPFIDGTPQPVYGGFYLTPGRITWWGRVVHVLTLWHPTWWIQYQIHLLWRAAHLKAG
jgi:hypothetical protein